MAFSYEETDLSTTTESGRLNAVRLLIQDTDEDNQLTQDEEILFTLGLVGDNIYKAASNLCMSLASKFAAKPDTQIDGITVTYGHMVSTYNDLSRRFEKMAQKVDGKDVGLPKAGGTKVSEMDSATEDTGRVRPAFRSGQFRNPRRYDNDNDWSWN